MPSTSPACTSASGRFTAVRGIDLGHGARARSSPFLGPNGAGKTSTIDMILGPVPARPPARVAVFGMPPRQAISHGLVSAVMQTGGLLKDLTVAETVAVHREPVRPHRAPSTRCWSGRASPASRTAGSASARAASSSGCASPWRCCPTPSCWSWTSRPPAWTSRAGASFWTAIRQDAGQGPDRAVRHPLPGGGRRLRRPDRPDAAGPDRGGRHRRARSRRCRRGPHRAGDAARRATRPRCAPCPASTASSCAATPS